MKKNKTRHEIPMDDEDIEDNGMEIEYAVQYKPKSETVQESVPTFEDLINTPEGRRSITTYIDDSLKGSI